MPTKSKAKLSKNKPVGFTKEAKQLNRLVRLGVNFWQFQRDFLDDPSRFLGVCWARGNGKSRIAALKIALEVFTNEAKGKPSNWLIVSASAPQAMEALRLVEGWSRVIYGVAAALEIIEEEVEFKTEDGLERYTRYRLRLGKSTQVYALSASPEAIRGYTANIWWDEACFFADDAKMWQSLQHCTRGRLKVIATSTPIGGPERKFYQIMHDTSIVRGKQLWSKHECDIYRAIREGRVYDLESEKAACDPFAWKQEMELQWLDGPNTWFAAELIAACEDERASTIGHGHIKFSRCFIGNDVGLRGDRWVATVLEASPDFEMRVIDRDDQKETYYVGELVVREMVVLHRSTFAEHDMQMARLFKKYNPIRMCIDEGGMGMKPTEDYQRIYGSRVEGVLFNVDNKGAMAMLGLEFMTDRRLLLPNDPDLRLDLRKLQRTVSAAGNVRFVAEKDSAGHADRTWSLLLALNAACTPYSPIEIVESDFKDSYYEMEGFCLD